MIQIQKKSDAAVIVLHEIYGVNQHIKDFCDFLTDQHYDVICPDLIKRDFVFDYSQEETAYRHFMEKIGFSEASKLVKGIISSVKDEYDKIFIIGFSIGATIAWLCSEEEGISGIVGYYGSRIRNYVGITPKCPTILFFPQEEQSCNVDDVISALDDKEEVGIHKYKGRHGFSDPYSAAYNAASSQKALNETMLFLKKHRITSIS